MDMVGFGRASATVPTQTYASSNLIGTPVPQVGQVQGLLPGTGAGSNKMQVAITIAVLIVAGYALHHWFFEK